MRRLVRSFQVIVIPLRHHFVLQENLGAIQLVIGTGHLDFRLIVISSRLCNLTALNKTDGLALGHFLPGPDIQFDQATGNLRVDMDHAGWVRFNPGGEHQVVGNRLGMDGRDLDWSFLRRRFPDRRRRMISTAKASQKGKQHKPTSVPHGIISDAET
jgi:hypothetical protein